MVTTTSITDAVVLNHDEGTGLPADSNETNASFDSGIIEALLAQSTGVPWHRDFDAGRGIIDTASLDTTNETVDVGPGLAFIAMDQATQQIQSGDTDDTYDTNADSGVTGLFGVYLPSATTVNLDADTDAGLDLVVDPTATNTVDVVHNGTPTNPALSLGAADSTAAGNGATNSNVGPIEGTTSNPVTETVEQTDVDELGSDPVSPAAGYRRVYAKSDGLYEQSSGGTVTGPLGGASLQKLLSEGNVVAVGDGEYDVFAPSNATPVQDAIDLVAGTSFSAGSVFLPPGTTSEDGPITHKPGVNIIGMGGPKGFTSGGNQSILKIATTGTRGIEFVGTAEAGHAKFDGFILEGQGSDAAAADAMVVDFNDAALRNLIVDNFGIKGWYGYAFNAAGNSGFYQNDFRRVAIADVDAGDTGPQALINLNAIGPSNRMGHLICYPKPTTSAANSNVIDFSDGGHLSVGHINAGTSTGRIADIDKVQARFELGGVNYEPTSDRATEPNEIIRVADATYVRIGQIVYNGASVTNSASEGVNVTAGTGDLFVGSVQSINSGVIANDKIRVANSGINVVYGGVSGDVANDSGGTLSPGISCLGDLTSVT